jgi:arylsulfatase
MIDHDKNVGQMLDLLDELGIAEDTFVMYSTDNGPHRNSWPDGGMTPFRSEKNTNWEGAFRIPLIVRWPGRIAPGSVANGIVQHTTGSRPSSRWRARPTSSRSEEGLPGDRAHLQEPHRRLNLLPYLTGKEKESPRKLFFYISDDGDVLGIRFDNWKMVFMEQRCQGTLQVWAEPFTRLRVPKLYNLRTDPYDSPTSRRTPITTGSSTRLHPDGARRR